jgi:hypothetical protein
LIEKLARFGSTMLPFKGGIRAEVDLSFATLAAELNDRRSVIESGGEALHGNGGVAGPGDELIFARFAAELEVELEARPFAEELLFIIEEQALGGGD